MQWLIGIDGGGTKTVGYAAGLDGSVLGRVEKGPGNYHTTGLAYFTAVVGDIVDELAKECGLCKADLRLISLGVAGADRPRDIETLHQSLAPLGCPSIINSDAKIALAAGLGKTEGIVLVAGTGSVAYGINGFGEVIRAGGWGQLASDEGSGCAIGRRALARVIKAAEGRDRKTGLLPRILKHWELADWDQLIGFINSPAATKAAIASLTKPVAEAARAGDDVAVEILNEAGDELADLVLSVISRGFETQRPVPVCLHGSIVKQIEPVRMRLSEALSGQALLTANDREAAAGAVLLGLEWLKKRNGEIADRY